MDYLDPNADLPSAYLTIGRGGMCKCTARALQNIIFGFENRNNRAINGQIHVYLL